MSTLIDTIYHSSPQPISPKERVASLGLDITILATAIIFTLGMTTSMPLAYSLIPSGVALLTVFVKLALKKQAQKPLDSLLPPKPDNISPTPERFDVSTQEINSLLFLSYHGHYYTHQAKHFQQEENTFLSKILGEFHNGLKTFLETGYVIEQEALEFKKEETTDHVIFCSIKSAEVTRYDQVTINNMVYNCSVDLFYNVLQGYLLATFEGHCIGYCNARGTEKGFWIYTHEFANDPFDRKHVISSAGDGESFSIYTSQGRRVRVESKNGHIALKKMS